MFRRKAICIFGLLISIWLNIEASKINDLPIIDSRLKVGINEDWKFLKGELASPEKYERSPDKFDVVDLPHTWNTSDPFDEQKGYYRGIAWYHKELDVNQLNKKGRTFLYLEGANQTAEVHLNGKLLKTHLGGYTAFCVDLSEYLNYQNDIISIKVDNSHDDQIPPLKGDFNFYGGIYRDVYLITTNSIHFDLSNLASPGIFIKTPSVSKEKALVEVQADIINENSIKKKIEVKTTILNAEGKVVSEDTYDLKLNKDKTTSIQRFELENPNLWSPDNPYLYTTVVEIYQSDRLIDQTTQPLGIRWFKFDENEGFYLNGKPIKLLGVNRHQDFEGMGNALPDEYHIRDIEMIKNLGANFLRTAHYPQDPAVIEACDRLGLLVSMEIPLDHEITDSDEFYQNTLVMQQEMIRQNFNHPSIIIWAYMNEMFLGKKMDRDSVKIYQTVAFAKQLEKLTRAEDPTRYTMIPNHGDFDVYHKSGLTQIPMIVGWNLYYGWYEENLKGFGKFIDRAHKELPDKPLLITEYGAGADPRIRSLDPKRFDFSIEWESQFHQSHLEQIVERKFVSGSAVWNMFDFGSESRNDAVPNVNSKGLCTFDRKPKDVYYLYKAWLSSQSVLEIGQANWTLRSGNQDKNDLSYSTQPILVYGNVDSAEFIANGVSLGIKKLSNKKAEWDVPFIDGTNYLEVNSVSKDELILQKKLTVDFKLVCNELSRNFENININLGSNFYFLTNNNSEIWIPEQEYVKNWGFKGGTVFFPRNRGIGSDKNIDNTSDDPIYQTQRVGIDTLKFNLVKGKYRVKLLFSELEKIDKNERVFDVFANGQHVVKALDVSHEYGPNAAVEKTFDIIIADEGLDIGFKSIVGEPVLNAVQIRKLDSK